MSTYILFRPSKSVCVIRDPDPKAAAEVDMYVSKTAPTTIVTRVVKDLVNLQYSLLITWFNRVVSLT